MYIVYVLRSLSAPKTYIGITDSVERRLSQHNSGQSFYTKRYVPWEVVCTEELANREDARKREKYLKSSAGRKYLEKVLN